MGDSDLPWPDDAVEVGRILGAWGVKGWVKVQPFAKEPQALFSSKRWFAKPAKPGLLGSAAGESLCLQIVQAKEHRDEVVAQVRGLEDRDAAQALRGLALFISRSSFPTPEKDEFYWVDLIGLTVSNRQQQCLGQVVGLIETGPHCVLRIRPADAGEDFPEAHETLIPFVQAYVDHVDLADRRVLVDWVPQG